MRKDKKADSRICEKTCPKNRTVSSSRQSVSHAGKRRRELLAVFLLRDILCNSSEPTSKMLRISPQWRIRRIKFQKQA